MIPGFTSAILGNSRQVTIYLPPGYDEQDERYPVLYVQDGQNVFDPERAFIRGQHWRLREAADAAAAARTAMPAIIVGIDNAGSARIDEYTATVDEKRSTGGRGDDYLRMLVDELKPLVDGRYRTRTDARDRDRRLVVRRTPLHPRGAAAQRCLRLRSGHVALGVVERPRPPR